MSYKRVFLRKRERSLRETPPNADYGGFSHGHLSTRQAKIRMECRVLSCGGAKGRHAKTRNSHHLSVFRVAPFRNFAPKTRLYDKAQISHHIFKKPQYQVVCLDTVPYIIHVTALSPEDLNICRLRLVVVYLFRVDWFISSLCSPCHSNLKHIMSQRNMDNRKHGLCGKYTLCQSTSSMVITMSNCSTITIKSPVLYAVSVVE